MRKYFLLFIGFIFFIFLLPIVFTKEYKEERIAETANNETNNIEEKDQTQTKENNEANKPYNYSKYGRIKLLHSNTGEVEELAIDEYLLGVVSAEMPASFEQEALNAQAIVARTYTVYSIIHNSGKHPNADICDNSNCCQAWISKENRLEKWEENVREEYWNKITNAVNLTKGKIITYEGDPIDAFFHANSGGVTEVPVNVWGGTNFPYLQSVQTSGEEGYSQYNSEVELTKEEFINKIKEKHPNFSIDFGEQDAIKVLEYTGANRIKTVKIGNLNLSGVEVRTILGLKSANFEINIENDKIKLKVTGYGHGVGMSQTGADSMAKQGQNCEEIIKHFYTGIEITNL